MPLTRKDFRAIASVLRSLREDYRDRCGLDQSDVMDDVAVRIAEALQKTNERFDADRFMRAVVTGRD